MLIGNNGVILFPHTAVQALISTQDIRINGYDTGMQTPKFCLLFCLWLCVCASTLFGLPYHSSLCMFSYFVLSCNLPLYTTDNFVGVVNTTSKLVWLHQNAKGVIWSWLQANFKYNIYAENHGNRQSATEFRIAESNMQIWHQQWKVIFTSKVTTKKFTGPRRR